MIRVGILGATGMVGQHYVALLQHHPWFEITLLAASNNSVGKPYPEAIGQWFPAGPLDVEGEIVRGEFEEICAACELVFSCCGGREKLERELAEAGVTVISHNASHRANPQVPLVIPEINAHHLGESKLIAKPNCSIQSYVLPLAPLRPFGIKRVLVTTLQSLSGGGKGAMDQCEVVPLIAGEEEKSQTEPLRILEREFAISATCTRVPIPYGHMASVSVEFTRCPSQEAILKAWRKFPSLDLPTAPKRLLVVESVPSLADGMAVSVGRLRPCNVLDWQFVGLSHNVIRGAAGGGVLTAECLVSRGQLDLASNTPSFAHSI